MTTWEQYLKEAERDIDGTQFYTSPYPRELLIDLRAYWLHTLDNFDASLRRSNPAEHPAFYRQETP